MILAAPSNLQGWARYLAQVEIPVLTRTAAAIAELSLDEEGVSAKALADVILTDPLMTARVFAMLARLRRGRESTDITRVEGCIVMMGLPRFLAACRSLPTVEAHLHGRPEALRGLSRVIRRARHAFDYAWELAVWRKDLDIEELAMAAMMHDLAEILVWTFAPDLALETREYQRHDPNHRSKDSQRAILGIELSDLQHEVVRSWKLPEILVKMMDDHASAAPRLRNVQYAVRVARHSANGWDNAALPADYEGIADLLVTTPERVRELLEGRYGPGAGEGGKDPDPESEPAEEPSA